MAKKEKAKPAAKAKPEKAAKPPKEKKVKVASPNGGFFLRMGDKLAMGIAAGLMLLMVFLGLGTGDATKPTAEVIKKATQEAESAISGSRAPNPEELTPTNLSYTVAQIETAAVRPVIPPEDYRFTRFFINPSPDRDILRRNPEVLAVAELAAAPVHLAFKYPWIERDMIYLIQEFKDLGLKEDEITDPKVKKAFEREKKRAERKQKNAADLKKGGAPKSPIGRAGGMAGFAPPGGGGGAGGAPTSNTRAIAKKLDELLPEDLPKIAQTIIPSRAVLLMGSFPYREQLREQAKALKLPETEDISTYFNRLEIQRREVADPTKPMDEQTGWANIDLTPTIQMMTLLDRTVGEWQEETLPPHMHARGLAIRLPQAQRGKYPEILLNGAGLQGIQKTLADYNNLQDEQRKALLPQKANILEKDDNFSIFGNEINERAKPGASRMPGLPPSGGKRPPRTGTPSGPAMTPLPAGGRTRTVNERTLDIAEFCFIRWLDFDFDGKLFRPGKTFEYRVRVVMDNPNYDQKDVADPYEASLKELFGPWSKPIAVTFAAESFLYADERRSELRIPTGKERVPVQIHQWLDWVQRREQAVPMGEWWVDRIGVARGEYIGRIEEKDMVVWNPAVQNAANTIGVDTMQRFRTDSLTTKSVLVDFEGGTLPTTVAIPGKVSASEALPAEVLIVHNDGRLVAHNWLVDKEEAAQKVRYDGWKQWFEAVKTAAKPPEAEEEKGKKKK